jgi:predicted MFS family arabinose efflux permease
MRDAAAAKRPFDALERMAYVNALFIVGSLGTLIAPALLESWSTYHWNKGQLGAVAGIELAGLATGSLSALYWQRRWNWRLVTVPMLILAVVGNTACIVFGNFAAVCIARALVGLAGGLLCGVYSAYLANIRSPVRMIAVTTFVQIGLEAVFIFFAPTIIANAGVGGLFALMALLFAGLLLPVKILPRGWPDNGAEANGDHQPLHRSWRGYPILLSFLPFIVIQTGVYTFLGEFGKATAHLSGDHALQIVGISVIFSSLGSVLAYTFGGRGTVWAGIGAAIILMGVTLFSALGASPSAIGFLVSISLLQIAWVFLNCVLYAALIDANNLLVPAATTLSCFGAAFGAGAMGYVLNQSGPQGALILAEVALMFTALLSLPFVRIYRPATS